MDITLYKNISDSKVLDKDIEADNRLSKTISDVQLFEPVDVLHPTFVIDAFEGVENFNYVYFEHFSRYYFCSITLENHKAILKCDVDPLMSHKNGIRNLNAMVVRNENEYNLDLPDELLPLKEQTIVYSRTDTIHAPKIGQGTLILHTI